MKAGTKGFGGLQGFGAVRPRFRDMHPGFGAVHPGFGAVYQGFRAVHPGFGAIAHNLH